MTATPKRPYAHRRDPDEPWRWRCPDCGSSNVDRELLHTDTERYKCSRCDWYGPVDELEDATEATA
jgi:rubredoxin